MSYNAKYWTCRPTSKDDQEKIRWYRLKNLEMAYNSKSENWMQWILWRLYRETGIKFNRQKIYWTRIYDFRCHTLWVVVEVDWWYHETEWKKQKDMRYDKYNLEVSAIKIYRIKPYDDCYAVEMVNEIKKDIDRNQRRLLMWLPMRETSVKSAETKNEKKFLEYIEDWIKWETVYAKMQKKSKNIKRWKDRWKPIDKDKKRAIATLSKLI